MGKGNWISLRRLSSSHICPCFLLKSFLAARPPFDGHLLIHDSGLPLTRYQFRTVLKRCLLHLGLGQIPISSHSFRIGAATTAATLGLSATMIKNIGRWHSNCYRLYVRPNVSV